MFTELPLSILTECVKCPQLMKNEETRGPMRFYWLRVFFVSSTGLTGLGDISRTHGAPRHLRDALVSGDQLQSKLGAGKHLL